MGRIPARSKRLTSAQQLTALRRVQPGSQFRFLKPGVFRWKGNVQPTPLSVLYTISIIYNSLDFSSPAARVITHPLRTFNGEPPPHMYDSERLCLYLPKAGEWEGSKFIAYTVLPWTSLWLYFYELWLITGRWLGGGKHPTSAEKK